VADSPTIVIIADGWPRDLFLEMLQDGLLPEIDEVLVKPGLLIEPVISTLPTVSHSCHASMLTASVPSQHGVAGFRYRQAQGGQWRFRNYFGRDIGQLNMDLSDQVATVFETSHYEHRFSVGGLVTRGADEVVRPIRWWSPRALLETTIDRAIERPHSIAVCALPATDALAHWYGPAAWQVQESMVSTSRAIGDAATRLQSHGLLDEARIVLVPDHGHRDVLHRFDLRTWLAGILGPSTSGRSVDSWRYHLLLNDAAAFLHPNSHSLTTSDVIELCRLAARQEGVSLACFRIDDTKSMIFGGSGGALIETAQGSPYRYSLLYGADPLELVTGGQRSATVVQEELHISTAYPDFLYQYANSYVAGRSPEVLLFAERHWQFGAAPRLGFRLGYHRGTHGGPTVEEVAVFAAIRGISPPPRWRGGIRLSDLLKLCGILSDEDARGRRPR
jgi:hypothetical protein